MLKQKQQMPQQAPARHKRITPRLLISLSVPLILILLVGVTFVLPKIKPSHAAAGDNQNCSLILPPDPLSAQGLATPYQLVATDPAAGPCNEANTAQSAFVQGAIIDTDTGQISIYNPLVIDQGTQPAVAPTAPTLPANNVVALWFGFQGMNLTLQNPDGTDALTQGQCVNGLPGGDIFGQFSYCNAPAFFAAANAAIGVGQLTVPPIGTANDGQSCPTVRDFSVVDQDQSDNVTTTYLVNADGTTAQNTAGNAAALQGANAVKNGSDNRLLAVALDGALGCTPFMAPDLADNGNLVPALPLNELQADAQQAAPVALVPPGDPMVLSNGNFNTDKTTAYRVGVDQAAFDPAVDPAAATTDYCNNIMATAPARIVLDQQFTVNSPSPDPNAANNLFTFLAQRLNTTWGATGGLNCVGLTGQPSPVQLTLDGNGVAIDATITVPGQ